MRRLVLAALAGLLLLPAYAQAQGTDIEEQIGEEPANKYDVGLNAGFGAYFGDVSDITGIGPAYGVTAAYNQSRLVAYEAAYQGYTTGIEDSDSNLSRNKLQATVKAGPELTAPVTWKPYAFAGVALDFTTAGSNPQGLDNAFQAGVPFGAGVDFFTESPVMVGARFTYDWLFLGGDVADFEDHPDGYSATINASAAF